MKCDKCGAEYNSSLNSCPYCAAQNDMLPNNKSNNINVPKMPWYTHPIIISICFGFSFLIFPIIPGIILLVLYVIKNKKVQEYYRKVDDIDNYKANIYDEADTYKANTCREADEKRTATEVTIQQNNVKIEAQNLKISELEKNIRDSQNELSQIRREQKREIENARKELIVAESEIYVDYNITSAEYKDKLSIVQLKEKELLTKEIAVIVTSDDAKSVINANVKQILRCFNSETSTIIKSVTSKNIDTLRSKLIKSYEMLNKIYKFDGVTLSEKLLENKLEQLNLMYSYEVMKENEREEQKAIREQMLEEEKVRREIEKEKTKIEKEESQFKNEISKLMKYLQKASDIEKQLYVDKINELEEKVKLLEKDKANVLEREQNTRAGFVYIISNIGSFGENIYKIGMTRRLEPMDRIKELSSASVPFEFDVHAMIFSEDAPKLENILHNTFDDKRVNKVNERKEFFNVTLPEIEKVVKENHNATVTFTQVALAEQYRQTLALNNVN